MKKRTFAVSISMVMACALIATAAGSDSIIGAWKLTMDSPRGERTSDLNFKGTDEELQAVMPNPRGGGEMAAAVTRNGNSLEWTYTMQTQRGEMKITYKGTVNGDTMTGTVTFGSSRTAKWKAVRSK